jgi:GDPmannose 4,6-dehydratase
MYIFTCIYTHSYIHIYTQGETGTVDEIGVDAADSSRVLIKIDPKYFRPTEVDILIGDPAKAFAKLGIFDINIHRYICMDICI